MAELIEHSGTVERTEAGKVFVRITSHSACGTCSARQACGLAETQEKIVEVAVLGLTVGAAGWSEGRGALASLGAVLLYYMVLWLFRRRIEHTIQFTITKN